MAEPLTIIAGIKVLGKLIGTGASLYKAIKEPSSVEQDLKAVQDLLGTGEQMAGCLPARAAPRLAARYVLLLSSAFGAAWRKHYGPRFGLDDKKKVEQQLEAAVRWALLDQPSDARVMRGLSELVRAPEEGPFYRALWEAFNKKGLPDAERLQTWPAPLIESADGEDRRRFETTFRLEWNEALASAAGRELRDALLVLDDVRERAAWVRELLVADMATWGDRQVFGNTRERGYLPSMPLGEMYVEPLARRARDDKDQPGPVRARIRALLEENQIVVVMADFGHGKSLTARMLALETARRYLGEPGQRSAGLDLPVFVKCQDAITGEAFTLQRAVQMASWHQLRTMLSDVRDTDAALEPPPLGQQTLYLIDGLDEMGHLERGITDLFRRLQGQVVGGHRAVLFSRPHVLPWEELKRMGVPVLEILPFDEGRSASWLERWNRRSGRPPVRLEDLRDPGLQELAATPILLFMLAYTEADTEIEVAPEVFPKDPDAAADLRSWIRRNQLYERFFQSIAWGKYEADGDRHPQVEAAARHLADVLADRIQVPDAPPGKDPGKARLIAAMLWLMARVAWEALCLEQRGKPLTQRKVENLLEEELDIDEGRGQVVCDGLLLALQADLSQGSRRILFGHKSFREFLVGRYWNSQLLQLVDGHADRTSVEAALLPGKLMDTQDKSFHYLRACLATWTAQRRRRIHGWAQDCFNDERIVVEGKQNPTLRADRWMYLRQAALAIGSAITESNGVRCADSASLRTLLTGFWLRGETPWLFAPALVHPEADLSWADLSWADLIGADLIGANLFGANLREASLFGADLREASLFGADLREADLREADLRRANLFRANLARSDLSLADLIGANLSEANLSGTNLSGTTPDGETLRKVGAILSPADADAQASEKDEPTTPST